MMSRTHMAFGAALAAPLLPFSPPDWHVPLVGVAALSALLPDLDHPNSTLGRYIKPLAYLLKGILGHRTITHSLLAIGVMSLVFFAFPWQIAAAIVIGYASHLLGDAISFGEYVDRFGVRRAGGGGIPLLWPSRKKFRARLLAVNGATENFIVMPGLVVVGVLGAVTGGFTAV